MFDIEQELGEKFMPKKKISLLLSESYSRLGYHARGQRVLECGSFLEFAFPVLDGGVLGDKKLHKANFCKDRFCPMCAWRRSLKIFGQVSKIMDVIASDYRFLFLTLTVPNCSPERLKTTLQAMQKGWGELRHQKIIRDVLKGSFKALEITRNKTTGFYHPHFHVILAVSPGYFGASGGYISRNKWLSMWQKAMNDSSITQVDIRTIKNEDGEVIRSGERLERAVCEITKYAVKSSDYIYPNDSNLTDKLIGELLQGVSPHSRFCSLTGVFREVQRQLKLDDMENGDLVFNDIKINDTLSYLIVRYGWSAGFYKIVDSKIIDSIVKDGSLIKK